jgi:hypothetical protein
MRMLMYTFFAAWAGHDAPRPPAGRVGLVPVLPHLCVPQRLQPLNGHYHDPARRDACMLEICRTEPWLQAVPSYPLLDQLPLWRRRGHLTFRVSRVALGQGCPSPEGGDDDPR